MVNKRTSHNHLIQFLISFITGIECSGATVNNSNIYNSSNALNGQREAILVTVEIAQLAYLYCEVVVISL